MQVKEKIIKVFLIIIITQLDLMLIIAILLIMIVGLLMEIKTY
jgi:hypothetical protein